MDCDQAMQIFNTTLDAHASAQLPPKALRHLEQCPACRRTWDEMRRVEEATANLLKAYEADPPAMMHKRILAALREERSGFEPASTPIARWRWLMPSLGMAATLALVAMTAYLMYPSRPPASPGADPNAAQVIPEQPFLALSDLTQWIDRPRQDLKELADSILGVTDGYLDLSLIALAQTPKE